MWIKYSIKLFCVTANWLPGMRIINQADKLHYFPTVSHKFCSISVLIKFGNKHEIRGRANCNAQTKVSKRKTKVFIILCIIYIFHKHISVGDKWSCLHKCGCTCMRVHVCWCSAYVRIIIIINHIRSECILWRMLNSFGLSIKYTWFLTKMRTQAVTHANTDIHIHVYIHIHICSAVEHLSLCCVNFNVLTKTSKLIALAHACRTHLAALCKSLCLH